MSNKVQFIEQNYTEGLLQVPEHLIGQVSKILQDQFGFTIEERVRQQTPQQQKVLRQQLNLIVQILLCSFKRYCILNQQTTIKQQIENIQLKKQFSKKFCLFDLHQLLYENQFSQEFRDEFENYLCNGSAEKDLKESRQITQDLKKELKKLISQLLLEVLKGNPITSLLKHRLNIKKFSN
ncbi:unnamed protein product (macronuclear) [Paramecium tetraurelia]|uniref:Uncharacterized protein n=1 Tax=Paramecium tetraurelia TaxID=5888 RepID=A0CIR8_PARTE|nr:uncharacterized protein GSPATT00007820001 [Paramecium tetraurelia]CAK70685.1 unnamed protein product [Paramecium tetraurelia]|eukprot:XP_001438082.1 hypothetical protein (macronuclear) [Paramecium tetraurelia strain d4-2]